jgi:hypothetical protein
MKIIRDIFIKGMVVSLSICTTLLFLEIFLRIFNPIVNQLLTPGTYISHPTRRYALRPHFSGKTYDQPVQINSLGLRDYEYPYFKESNTFRILAVGDSCTFGVGLDLSNTYPKQLERMLRTKFSNKKIEVINCGVPSYNTVYEYLFLKEEGIKYHPDLVLIGYVYNDSVHNYPLTSSRFKLLNIFKDFLRKLYSYEFIVDKIYKLNYKIKGFAARDPGVRRENLRYVYSDEYIGWRKNKEAFRLLSDFSHAYNIPIVYIIFPKLERLGDGYPYEFYHQIVKEALKNEPYVIDLLPYLRGKRAEDLRVFDYDHHPNRYANAIISRVIFDTLLSEGLIDTN